MAGVNPELRRNLEYKLGVKKSRVYELIQERVQQTFLPRHLAAIHLASELGINVNKYVESDDDWETIRTAGGGSLPQTQPQKTTISKTPKPKKLKVTDLPDDPYLSLRDATASTKNAELYPTVYAFENSFRRFVANVMERKFSSDWWTKKVSKGTKDKVEIRRLGEKRYPWHSRRNADPVYYTDISDLTKILKTNAKEFREILGKNYERALVWIEDIERTRHVIAHNNPVMKKDRERLEMSARDWSVLARDSFSKLT